MEAVNEAIIMASAAWWVLPALFVFCVVDGFFPVVPSESLIVALASVAVTSGSPNFWLLVPVGALGAFYGDQVAYRLGRAVGTERWRWMRTPRARKAFTFAHHELMRRGALLLFTARYIPVGRVAVNFTAGATRFPPKRFALLDAFGCLTWSAYSSAVGAIAGQWMEHNKLLGIVISVVVAMILGFLLDKLVNFILKKLGRNIEVDVSGIDVLRDERNGAASSSSKPGLER
ncbi:membrane protein DedA with SNARE-associated domain [Neomicrococcus aestuarii]|uniref:Membrane protein DedA with SNARE-associated domain n=1 Tax=Neomicrococcus aestuarii TaxID=556325 RepID=A0A7W8X0Z3_9MICC|nr:DedA family protein [Neomicrococcus aestuarii]MBB5512224.1 membrane protein DedA with SNARE-associated domain [Neomicrococcus aestuarii]